MNKREQLNQLVAMKKDLNKELRDIDRDIKELVAELTPEDKVDTVEVGKLFITNLVFQHTTLRKSFDTTKFKNENPEMYNQYIKESFVKTIKSL